ncbi:hypothetical protein HID58_090551, partial [Brassica napus]
KGALLPVFPKEYCSPCPLCSRGFRSVATSFIFTPSERIKQQMQDCISLNHPERWSTFFICWMSACFVEISLTRSLRFSYCYQCLNTVLMPKLLEMQFYVYENMKRMVLPSIGPCGQAAQPQHCKRFLSLNMVTWDDHLLTARLWRTSGICCCLFHNPVDVVKTRLQTQEQLSPTFKLILWLQIPGSKTQHPSVYQALQSIRKREGHEGYTGLIPRLVMYMSQGAIFFASYEFYKSILSLEDLSARWHKTKDGDNPNPL